MTTEATAQALVADPAPSESSAPTEQEQNAELAAIWDKHNEEPAEPEAAPESTPEAEAEPEAEPEPIPSSIPTQFRALWNELPEDAKTAVQDFTDEANRKLSANGRLVQGIKPIQDVLIEATRTHPQLADMKPADVAKDLMQLADQSARFKSDPVNTMMDLINQHGLGEAIGQALQGQPVDQARPQLQQHIAQLERQIAQMSDPERIRSMIEQTTAQQTVLGEITSFSAQAEHWDKVEDLMPQFVALEKELNPQASEKDILRGAYEAAVSRLVPDAKKAPSGTTDQVVTVADPEKAKAVLKAKSTNVSGKPTKPRPMTEDERLQEIWERHQG